MFKVLDYREHAEECRKLAQQALLPHIREQLSKMADNWDDLAASRERYLARNLIIQEG